MSTAQAHGKIFEELEQLQAWRDGALRIMRQGLTLTGPTDPKEFLAEVEAKLRRAAPAPSRDGVRCECRRTASLDCTAPSW